jgi:hypothetical protein
MKANHGHFGDIQQLTAAINNIGATEESLDFTVDALVDNVPANALLDVVQMVHLAGSSYSKSALKANKAWVDNGGKLEDGQMYDMFLEGAFGYSNSLAANIDSLTTDTVISTPMSVSGIRRSRRLFKVIGDKSWILNGQTHSGYAVVVYDFNPLTGEKRVHRAHQIVNGAPTPLLIERLTHPTGEVFFGWVNVKDASLEAFYAGETWVLDTYLAICHRAGMVEAYRATLNSGKVTELSNDAPVIDLDVRSDVQLVFYAVLKHMLPEFRTQQAALDAALNAAPTPAPVTAGAPSQN